MMQKHTDTDLCPWNVVDADNVILTSTGIPALSSAAPSQFGGPGDRWSPETLIVGAIADCFILTFRAVARASTLPWTALRCNVTGTLDRIERVEELPVEVDDV